MKTIRLTNGAAAMLTALAKRHEVPTSKYLEALLHYAASCERRPGSWEANQAFSFDAYDDRHEEGRYTDRWFDKDKQHAFEDDR